MRIVNFSTAGAAAQLGVLRGAEILALGKILGPDSPRTPAELLTDWSTTAAKVAAALGSETAPGISRADVRLHAPVPRGALILCVGANYRDHLEEFDESLPQQSPSFIKSPNAVVGPDDSILLPTEFPDLVDYEGELCVVFGRSCHHVRSEDAMEYVAGYTLLNDISARDQMHLMLGAETPTAARWGVIEMLKGKQLPSFAPIGPAVLTADEVADPRTLQLTTRVNGEVRQNASLNDLVFSIPQLIEEMSRYYSFAPGDLLSTGTPAGVGAAQVPPRFLRAGDEVTVEVPQIGSLTNRVAHAQIQPASLNSDE
jgi:2-keto-4-pentenoate hydratase/2-oxohepta-3-ene-1,7-dioic acid hydratase in catechol pathway